jgi:hypothetical protein
MITNFPLLSNKKAIMAFATMAHEHIKKAMGGILDIPMA